MKNSYIHKYRLKNTYTTIKYHTISKSTLFMLCLTAFIYFSIPLLADNHHIMIEDITPSYSSFDIDSFGPKSKDIADFLNPIKTFYQPPDNLMFLNTKTKLDYWNNFLNYLTNFYFSKEPNSLLEHSIIVKGQTPPSYKDMRTFVYNLLINHADHLVTATYEDSDGKKLQYYKRKNIYLFIGTSPIAPVLAFLTAIQTKYDIIKNQSKFRYSLDGSMFIDIPYSSRLLDDSENIDKNTLFSHFYKYLDPCMLEGANIIIVDFALSGINVGSFIRNIKHYIIASGVKNYSLFADIFTLQPSELYNNFLSSLSTFSNIKLTYSSDYWYSLRKSLYMSGYDNPHSYYNYILDDPRDSLLIRYDGTIYSIYGRYINSKLIYRNEPFERYIDTEDNKKVDERNYYLLDSKYTDHWIQDLKDGKQPSIRKDFKRLVKAYADTIEKDAFFTSNSPCVWLFGNM